MMERSRRLALGIMTVVFLSAPGAAFAHGEMLSQTPGAGSTVKKPVDHIRINFTEAPTEDVTVVVRDECGTDLVDEVFAQNQTLHVFFADDSQRGKMDVRYRVVSSVDGHVTSGKYSFQVKGEAVCDDPVEPSGEPSPDDGEANGGDVASGTEGSVAEGAGLPLVAFIVGGAALGGIVLLVRTRL